MSVCPGKKLGVFALVIGFICACNRGAHQDAEIVLRNDIEDKEFNEIVVDHVVSQSGLSSKQYRLRPGEETPLLLRGITALRFSRRYRDFTRVYDVNCADERSKRVVLKLIDVHLNRLPGGCELVRRGESRRGVIEWEKGKEP